MPERLLAVGRGERSASMRALPLTAASRIAEENVVIGVRVKRRIEIDQIDTRVGKLLPIRKPF